MLSYTGRRQQFQDITNASDSSTLTLGDRLMNQSEKRILASRDWPFLERVDTTSLTTTASTQGYNLPQRVSKPKSIYVVVSSIRYTPREVTSRAEWDRLNQLTYTSDFPVWFYIFNGQVLIWPTPASSSNVIGLIYKVQAKDLTIADYTTGTIVSIAASGTAVVGSGTTWTTKMADRWMRITDSDTANTGDGFWYPLSAVGSATTITLGRAYAGTAISAGSAAYAIGQMSLLPEGYTDLPVFDAARQYFTSVQPEPTKAKLYDGLFEGLMKQMVEDQGDKTSSPVLSYGDAGYDLINPNLTVKL